MKDSAALRRKAEVLRALHHGPEPLLLLNAWDAASACVVESLGFPAIATTSSGVANALGYADGEHLSREEMLAAVTRIARAVAVPVSADLEAGYGANTGAVAETVRLAVTAGVAGFNLEDSRGGVLLPLDQAVARVQAARATADAAGVPLVINARTDVFHPGYFQGDTFKEAARRANAYREVGADCLFLPFVSDAVTIGRLVKAIHGPINILAAVSTPPLPELKDLGVARVSVGGALARAALTVIRQAAQELHNTGSFDFTGHIISHAEMNTLFNRE